LGEIVEFRNPVAGGANVLTQAKARFAERYAPFPAAVDRLGWNF